MLKSRDQLFEIFLQLPNPKKSIANFIQYQEFKKIFIFADFLHAK